jgi:TrmH family RNA methyltransferase
MVSEVEIKHVNALKVKKYRLKYAQFIAEGNKIIKELIAEGMEPVCVYTTDDSLESSSSKRITEKQLDRLTALQHHHGSLAVFRIPKMSFEIDGTEWIVMLDDIQDPGNMGTILRTCDWFGIRKIICSDGCVDVYNPKVVQASMASVGRVQVMEAGLAKIICRHTYPVYGAVLNGNNYLEQDFSAKGFLLIGNEGHGIGRELQELITHPVTIPRKGKAESLNAAIAAALIIDKLR